MLQAGRWPVQVQDEVDFPNAPDPSSRTMAPGSTQPLREIVPGIFLGLKSGRRVGLTTLPPSVSLMCENVGASTSHKPERLHDLYKNNVTFYLNTDVRASEKTSIPASLNIRLLCFML
jgi:hypothetical protein